MNRILRIVLCNFFRIPGAYFKLRYYAKHADEYDPAFMFQHINKTMNLVVKGGNIDLQVYGKENIPKEDGYMLYANHQGLFDVVAIASTFEGRISCVYKKEIANVPFLKQIYKITNSYAMDREDVRQSLKVIQSVTEEVKSGGNYLIFPEGTRSKNGNVMGEFHGGSFRCAVKAKCPIVPIAFIDSWKVFEQKGSKRVSVQIHYLEPIPYETFKDMKPAEVAVLVKERIQATLDAYSK